MLVREARVSRALLAAVVKLLVTVCRLRESRV